jgi:hypothetical protein
MSSHHDPAPQLTWQVVRVGLTRPGSGSRDILISVRLESDTAHNALAATSHSVIQPASGGKVR